MRPESRGVRRPDSRGTEGVESPVSRTRYGRSATEGVRMPLPLSQDQACESYASLSIFGTSAGSTGKPVTS